MIELYKEDKANALLLTSVPIVLYLHIIKNRNIKFLMQIMNTATDELLWVTRAEYADGYKLLLTFNNNVTKLVDLKDSLYGEVFEPLRY